MLSKQEVQELLEGLEKLKSKQGSAKNKGDDGDERRQALTKKSQNDLIYFAHPLPDDFKGESNDYKPFYKAIYSKLEGSNAIISLHPDCLKDCKIPEFMKPNFSLDISKTLEYSKASENGLADMVEIDELNKASLVFNLANRYKKSQIYTYVGPILLALNPFGPVEGISGPEVMKLYQEIVTSKQPLQLKKQLDPHIYAISAMAYRNLQETKVRQAIVISGESGAGKTESAKIAMEFLTKVAASGQESAETDIGKKILDCNPILEGFGNSKTLRNNNSSRFGKYVLMYFGLREKKVFGAIIKNYLLEKSRVVKVAAAERGYHIFYFLIRGASIKLLETLYLVKPNKERYSPQDFQYLKPGGDLTVEHDVAGYKGVEQTMMDLKFSKDQIEGIWRALAAVLLLGELNYDPASFDDVQTPTKPGKIKNPERAEQIAKLLGFQNPDDLLQILMSSCTKVGKDLYWTANSMKKCQDARDALAKQIYNNLFNWLVKRMNVTIEPAEIANPSFSEKAKTIGLLDIFGFENFPKGNNFEQLCINYVNEKLHKLYIAAIFEAEKMELTEEGLTDKLDQIQYPDLKVLDVIRALDYKLNSGPYANIKFDPPAGTGIFTTIDDQCTSALLGKTVKWEDVSDTLFKDLKNNKTYSRDSKVRYMFKISHSAQEVNYEMKEFIERNIDAIGDFLNDTIIEKCWPQISMIYQNKLTMDEEVNKGKVYKTIWGKFNLQMDDLMNELAEPLLKMQMEKPINPSAQKTINVENCELHFIRCIKPRPKPEFQGDQPGLFIHALTFQQITYMGVLESVDLKQKNFPFRKKFEDFYSEYELLSPKYATIRYYQMNRAEEDFTTLATQIMLSSMQGLGGQYYAIGRFKILMMPEARMVLDKCKEKAAIMRNQSAEKLKKAFSIYFGAIAAQKRIQNIQNIQARYKENYLKKQVVWAEQYRQKFDNAIIAYKAEKLKAFEQRAALCIKDSLKKHIFRNHMKRAIKAQGIVIRSVYSSAKIRTLTKYLMSNMLAKKIISNAFNKARERINGKAAWNVQRAFRGYLVRNQGERLNWVKDAIAAKENLRLHVSAKKIQKRLKGLIVRRRIMHMNKVASSIQAHFRMRWTRQVFQMIKKNTMILQRGFRRYMARRDMIKERMKRYLTQEFKVMDNVREMEQFQLFTEHSGQVRNVTPYTMKKIFLFSRVADVHVLTDLSEMHSTPWSAQWMKLYKDNVNTETPIMMCQVGASHSLATTGRGKQYCWGWNDNGQCARDPMCCDEVIIKQSSKVALFTMGEEIRNPTTGELVVEKAKQMLAVEDRNLILTQDNFDLYAWGGNERGQLGLGHYQDVSVPTKIDFFSKNKLKVTSIAAGGNLTLASCENGDAFAWPFVKTNQKHSYPCQMPFSDKIKIQRVSCGYNFGFFISQQGLVYAVGKDNQDGQLGLGHQYPNDIPELIGCFKEAGERIDAIECGFRHSIAKSTLGKVYTWGWNAHGQLGQGTFDSELSPRQIILERGKLNKDKAIQIAAGYSHSIIMTEENRTLLWFGTSGALSKQTIPTAMPLSEILSSLSADQNQPANGPNNMNKNKKLETDGGSIYNSGQLVDFSVVKVNCSWSKSLSVTNLMIADLRAVNQVHPHQKLFTALKSLSIHWDHRDVMPPYLDVISGLFSSTVMRKPAIYKQQTTKDPKNATTTSKKIGISMSQTGTRPLSSRRR